jgi:hypothetical protein
MVEAGEAYICTCGCRDTWVIPTHMITSTSAKCWFREDDGKWRAHFTFDVDHLRPHPEADKVLADFTAWRLVHG